MKFEILVLAKQFGGIGASRRAIQLRGHWSIDAWVPSATNRDEEDDVETTVWRYKMSDRGDGPGD